MRTFIGVSVIGAAVAFGVQKESINEPKEPEPLGSNKCTWGPSYWCESAENQAECGVDDATCAQITSSVFAKKSSIENIKSDATREQIVAVMNTPISETLINGSIIGGPDLGPLRLVTSNNMIGGVSVAAFDLENDEEVEFALGYADEEDKRPMTPYDVLQYASLSKEIAFIFAVQLLAKHNIPLDTPVNKFFRDHNYEFQLTSPKNVDWAEEVTILHLLSHKALEPGAVNFDGKVAPTSVKNFIEKKVDYWGDGEKTGLELLKAMQEYRDAARDAWFKEIPKDKQAAAEKELPNPDWTVVLRKPGSYSYSSGGYKCLELICEVLTGKTATSRTRKDNFAHDFLHGIGLDDGLSGGEGNFRFDDGLLEPFPTDQTAIGHFVNGNSTMSYVTPFAGGGIGTARTYANFVSHLYHAYHDTEGSGSISHKAAHELTINHAGGLTKEAGNTIVSHSGMNAGFNCEYWLVLDGPDKGKGLVVLTNSANYVPDIGNVIKKAWGWQQKAKKSAFVEMFKDGVGGNEKGNGS